MISSFLDRKCLTECSKLKNVRYKLGEESGGRYLWAETWSDWQAAIRGWHHHSITRHPWFNWNSIYWVQNIAFLHFQVSALRGCTYIRRRAQRKLMGKERRPPIVAIFIRAIGYSKIIGCYLHTQICLRNSDRGTLKSTKGRDNRQYFHCSSRSCQAVIDDINQICYDIKMFNPFNSKHARVSWR